MPNHLANLAKSGIHFCSGPNMTNLRRKIRYCYLRLRRLKGDPRKIAWGMALGVFIGVTPTIPFHMISALALAHIFRISRIAAVMGVWISNPITIPPFYYFSFKIGKWLLYPNHDFIFASKLRYPGASPPGLGGQPGAPDRGTHPGFAVWPGCLLFNSLGCEPLSQSETL